MKFRDGCTDSSFPDHTWCADSSEAFASRTGRDGKVRSTETRSPFCTLFMWYAQSRLCKLRSVDSLQVLPGTTAEAEARRHADF